MESSIVCTCAESEFEDAVKGWKQCIQRFPYSKMQDGKCFVEIDDDRYLPHNIDEISIFQNSKLFSSEFEATNDARKVAKEKKAIGAACFVRNVAGIPPGGKLRIKKAQTLAKKRKRFEVQEEKTNHKIKSTIQKMKEKFLEGKSKWLTCETCECKITRARVKVGNEALTCPVCNSVFHFPELEKVKELRETLKLIQEQKNNIVNPIGWKIIYST